MSDVGLVQSLKIQSNDPIAYRGKIANAVKADYLVSLHCDGSATNLDANLAKIIYKYTEPETQSKTLGDEIKKSYTLIPGKVISDMANNPKNLLGVLSSKINAKYKILIEMGYMTSPKHMKILVDNSETIVNDIYNGIQNHISKYYSEK